MSVYGYGDKRKRQDEEALKILLHKHREHLQKQENLRRQLIKENYNENLQVN